MSTMIRSYIRAAFTGVAALAASAAWAQGTEPMEPAAPSQPAEQAQPAAPGMAASAIDERKMDQFADAYVAVQEIQANAAAELDQAAGDPAKEQQTQSRIESEMIAAVERTGLNLDEFNGIVQTMSADPDLRARIAAKIRERIKG